MARFRRGVSTQNGSGVLYTWHAVRKERAGVKVGRNVQVGAQTVDAGRGMQYGRGSRGVSTQLGPCGFP